MPDNRATERGDRLAKKKVGEAMSGLAPAEIRQLVDPLDKIHTIERQCDIYGLSRSGYYYHPNPCNPRELAAKAAIDRIHTDHPALGCRRIAALLPGELSADPRTVLKCMREMGIQAACPKPCLPKADPERKIHPYLLNNIEISRANQVWSTDTAYVPMNGSFMCLSAIIDWWSRHVISWVLSDTLEIEFVPETARNALKTNEKPEIMNSDQGSHYTSPKHTGIFLDAGVKAGMDHRGRCFDNIYIERFWRSFKYELIYINEISSPRELMKKTNEYIKFYNNIRPHQSLSYSTPAEVHRRRAEPKA
jgi:putative transposase